MTSPGEVPVRAAATSVNPIDYERRAGLTKDFYPINFLGLMGVDFAGTFVVVGPGVDGFSRGDRVFTMAADIYAKLCVVNAAILAKVPKRLDLMTAAGDDDWRGTMECREVPNHNGGTGAHDT